MGVLGLALLFGVVTLVALEGGEVVLLVTVDGDGARRETRAWVAQEGGDLWVEAANPERGFYRDIVAGSIIEVVGADGTRTFRAQPLPNPAGQLKIRTLLRQKYGWADAWIGLIADTSNSIGIRLEAMGQE